MDENGDGLNIQRGVQVGSEGSSGMVTDDSETFRLHNVESEVAGGACMTGLYAYVVTHTEVQTQ